MGDLGLVVGIAAAAGALIVIWAIASGKISDLLVVRPAAGIAPVARDDLWYAEMALAREEHPWVVRPCPEEPRAHFVAEWKLADARWWGLIQRNRLSSAYRAWFSLDERRHELRSCEERTTVNWSAGGLAPGISWGTSSFRGIVLFERTREIVLGLRDDPPLSPGVVVDYDFDPWRVKAPIIRAALERGWSYRPVVTMGQLEVAS